MPSNLNPNCAPYAYYEIVEMNSVTYPVPAEYVTMQYPDPDTVTISVTSAQMDALGGHSTLTLRLRARSTILTDLADDM